MLGATVDLQLGSNHILKFQNQVVVPSQKGVQLISGEHVTHIESSLDNQLQLQIFERTFSYYMRFDPCNSTNLQVSPSGLVCTNTDVREQKGISIFTQGFSSGTHYWEIICPLSCEGIQVGIVMKGWNINQLNLTQDCHLLEFKTTTQRVIGLKLNLEDGSLRCWLNGNIHDKKSVGVVGERIKPGTWFPIITLRGMGNSLMLNPFAVDPDHPMNLFAPIQQQAETQYDAQEEIEKTLKKLQFVEKFEIEQSPTQVTQVLDKNIILLQNNQLKIVSIDRGKIMDILSIQDNRPILPTDVVTLSLPTSELDNLLNLTDWVGYASQVGGLDLWRDFMTSISNGQTQANCFSFQIQVLVAKSFFLSLIQFLENNLSGQRVIFDLLKNNHQEEQQQLTKSGIVESTLNELKNLMGVAETKQEEPKTEAITQDVVPQQRAYPFSFEQTFIVLTSVLNLDESLQAMSLHKDASVELKTLLGSSQNRLFSAFARLNTFLDSVATNSPHELAEEGYFKRPGPQLSYGHFLQPSLDVLLRPNETGYNIAQTQPDNRMLSGRLCGNVALSQTINNIPSVQVNGGDLKFLAQKMPSPYFGLRCDDTVRIFNGELTLQEVCQIDLRSIQLTSVEKPVLVQVEPKAQQKQADQICDIFKILENYSHMEEECGSPQDELKNDSIGGYLFDEPYTEVNDDFVGQLHAMGFPISVCKKALQRTRNEGLNKALDIIFDVQQEALQFEQQKVVEKSSINFPYMFKTLEQIILKPEWLCDQCTLFNTDQRETCEACDAQAPTDAYYDPSDVERPSEVEVVTHSPQELCNEKELTQQFIQQLTDQQITDIGDSTLVEGDLLSPIVVCTIFNPKAASGCAALSLKKVSYSLDYLRTFFVALADKGHVCTISNEWIADELTPSTLEDALLANPHSNYLVRTLYPVFKPQQQLKLIVTEQTLIKFQPGQHIISSDYIKQGNVYSYLTVVSQDTNHILVIHQLVDNIPTLKQEIPLGEEKVLQLHAYLKNDQVTCLVVTAQHILQYNFKEMSNPTIQDRTPPITPSQRIISLTVSLPHIHVLVRKGADTQMLTMDSEDSNSTQLPDFGDPTLEQITSAELQKLESLIHNEPIQFESNSSHSTGAFNSTVREHALAGYGRQQTLTLRPTTPSSIINLDLCVVLTQKKTNESTVAALTKQDPTGDVKRFFNKAHKTTNLDVQRLPLSIYSFTGSQFNFKTLVTKFLYQQEGAFTPNYPNAEFVLRHLHGKRMTPITVTIESGLKNVNCGFPLGSGLIFTADHPSQFNQSSCFAGMELTAYKEWVAQRKNFPEPIQPWEPVGCFEFEDSTETLTQALDVQRACNYILLKPTNFRRKPYDNTIHFKKNPLEIKLFQSNGYESTSQEQPEEAQLYLYAPQHSVLVSQLMSQMSIQVRYRGETHYEPLKNIMECVQVSEHLIDQLRDASQCRNSNESVNLLQQLPNIAVDASLRVRLNHKQLQNKEVESLQITLTGGAASDWQVSYMSVSGTKPIDVSNVLPIRGVRELRYALLNVESYEQVNAKILRMMTDPSVPLGKRIVATKLLTKVAALDQQLLDLTFRDLQLKAFLQLNLLTIESDMQEQTVTQLLTLYEQRPEFAAKISKATQELLQELQSGLNITQRGLTGFMNVLRYLAFQSPAQTLASLTEQFNDVLNHIEQIKGVSAYAQLAELGLHASYLDEELFSLQYLQLIGIKYFCVHHNTHSSSETQDAKPSQPSLPIASRIHQQMSKNQQQIRSFTIDLQNVYDLDRIIVRFAQHEHFLIRFRVQVWAYSNNTKQLLVDESCGEWILSQVASLAYKHKTLGRDLECLGYAVRARTRHLLVQVTFGQTATIKRPADTSNIPQIPIAFLPEVYGQLVEGVHAEAMFVEQIAPATKQSNVVVGNSLTYKKYDLPKGVYLLDATTQDMEVPLKEHDDRKDATELRKELTLHRESLRNQLVHPNLNHQQVKNMANKILSLQKQLLEVQPCVSSLNLSFQYTYCYHILELLREIHLINTNTTVNNSKQSLAITNRIYYGLLLEQEGPLVNQARNFLSEQLIDNIQESEWIKFALGAYESHKDLDAQLCENLKDIPVPLSETIAYISLQLHSPKRLPNSIHEQAGGGGAARDLAYARLVSLLSVVLGWYRLLPSVVVGQAATSTSKARNMARTQPSQWDRDDKDSVYTLVMEAADDDLLLERSFDVCVWVAHQGEQEEFDGMFGLAVDLFVELVRVSPSQSVVRLMASLTGEKKLLNELILTVLKINSPASTLKLDVLLRQLYCVHDMPELYRDWLSVQSLDEPLKVAVMAEKQHIGYTRRLMVYTLHGLLGEVVQRRGETWIDQVNFIVGFLVYGVQQLNADIKDQQSTKVVKRGVEEATFAHFVEHTSHQNYVCALCPPVVVEQLVKILSETTTTQSQSDYAYTHSLWQLTFRVLLRTKPYHILRGGLFEAIVRVFLLAHDEVQQAMFTELLTLTNNLLTCTSPHYHKDLSASVLGVLFDTITSYYGSTTTQSDIRYDLIKGWLGILQPTKGALMHPLTMESTQSLLTFTAHFLYTYGQFGGIDGVQAADLRVLQSLEVADGLLVLLLNAEDESETPMLRELFVHSKSDFSECMGRLLQWSMVNHNSTAQGSPALDLISHISECVFGVYERVADQQRAMCVKELFRCQSGVDDVVMPLLRKHKLSVSVGYGIVRRAQKLLEQLFDLWIVNDDVALEVAFQGGVFDYLLDKMGISVSSADVMDATTTTTKTSPIRSQKRRARKQASLGPQAYHEPTLHDELREEELATNITVINLAGQIAVQQGVDWSANKKLPKTRILLLSMSGVYADEYQLVLKLDRVCEMKDMCLGFQVFTTDFTDKVLACPSAVHLEVSLDQSIYYPLGKMSIIEDETYRAQCVRMFSKNFAACPTQATTFESYLRALGHHRVQYLKFRIRRPLITFLEASPVKSYKNISIAINCLSIRGHDVSKLPLNVDLIVHSQQEATALNIIGQLCSVRFQRTLYEMANNDILLRKVQQSFEKFALSLSTYEQQLSPLILAIATHNAKLGDWIVEQLLHRKRTMVHAKLLNEIILVDQTVNRVRRLHNFLLGELMTIDYQCLIPFIDSYCVVLAMSAKNVRLEGLAQPEPLDLALPQLQHLVEVYAGSHQLASSKLLIKLIVVLVYMPYPYECEADMHEPLLECVWAQCCDSKPYMLELLAPLVIGSEASMEWFLRDGEKLIRVVDLLERFMVETPKHAEIRCVLGFLAALAQIPRCADHMASQLLRIYGCIFVEHPQTSLIKDLEHGSLALLTSLISSVVQAHPQQQEQLVHRLILDIQQLSQVRDMQFVSHLLVPLLNSERTVPVCINFWDDAQRRFITDPRRLVPQKGTLSTLMHVESPSSLFTLADSKILSQSDKVALGAHFKTLEGWHCVNNLDVDQAKLISGVIRRAPFLLVMRCSHAQERRTVVVHVDEVSAATTISENEFSYAVPASKASFAYASNEVSHEFRYGEVGQLQSYHDEIEMALHFGESVGVWLQFAQDTTSRIVFPLATDEEALPYTLQEVECWVRRTVLTPPTKYVSVTNQILSSLSHQPSNTTYGGLNQLCFAKQYFKADSPYNYFRATPTYNLPCNLTLEQVVDLVQLNQMTVVRGGSASLLLQTNTPHNLAQLHALATKSLSQTNGIVDVELNALALIESLVLEAAPQVPTYPPEMNIFQAFEAQDGVKAIIKVVQDGIKRWRNATRAQIWSLYIDELWSFCFLPSFFNTFMKNKQCVELLFQLLAGVPDEVNPTKKWDDEEQSAVKFIYQTLIEIFRSQNTSQLRELAISQDLLARILDRIALVAKEKKRLWSDSLVEEVESTITTTTATINNPTIITSTKDIKKQQPTKKKGIGYASDNTGQNTKWNTQDYVDSKKVRNEQLRTLLAVVEQFFDFPNWHLSQLMADRVLRTLFESALLPLLESAFRSGSLLEMTKESDLYQGYMKVVVALSKHRILAPVFLDVPRNYFPQQAESLFTLMTNLRGNAKIFLNCMQSSSTEVVQSEGSQALSIMEAHSAMEAMVNRFQLCQSDSDDEDLQEDKRAEQEEETANELIKEILEKPLPEAYRLLLADLRFDYVSMKENNRYKHHYASSIQANYTPSQAKLVRLAQEFADMSTALPIEHTNAIFARADKERTDVMKAMVMGAKGTPYAHGAYVFDIYFDDNYPNGPPKMNLSTTGAAKVRFNPNLYSCGKVCLSLLGTWRGNASENWDPKISTLLQVVVSTQAIIMSEEIYFNEPGFEGEAGTEEGDKKNEAYSNIVRYCNIKFAMTQQIRTPPKGFETVVKRHFYLKKAEILEECNQWLTLADQREASYTGLINDHNSNWCSEFKASKTKYRDMLAEAIKELTLELNKLEPPNAKDLKGTKLLTQATRRQQKSPRKQRPVDIHEGMANLDDVDMTEDVQKVVAHRELNIQDESVRDRWSRYIGAMGLDAVQKQSAASVFLSGLGAVGIEIAKNVVLSGVKRLTIHDTVEVEWRDLAGQFFLTEKDLGLNRAQQSLNKIQQLNYYVRVDTLSCEVALPQSIQDIESKFPLLTTYQAIVLASHQPNGVLVAWSAFCRLHKIKLIVCSVQGLHARIINDWGEEFLVMDKNGEQAAEVMIKDITLGNPGKVELLTGSKHDLEDGDVVRIDNVQGMEGGESKGINGTMHKVKVINKSSFFIEDTSLYTEFIRNGTVKVVKVPILVKFLPLGEVLAESNTTPPFDPYLCQSDYIKMDNTLFSHIAYQTMSEFKPRAWNLEDLAQFLEVSKKYYHTVEESKLEALQNHLAQFALTAQVGEFAPLAAFLGGFAASEVIKCLTNKFMPVQQLFYTDCTELSPSIEAADLVAYSLKMQNIQIDRKTSLVQLLGQELVLQLEQTKLFMVGCGAIGCELLKNFAMLNIGVSGVGSITITDPDHIETSNLNRQFLFREKHIRKPKSSTAAAAVIHMNALLKGRIVARFDKVYEGTENVFTDQFFTELTLVANALDNVQARRYVDLRCVSAKIPLLESGTLGTKGHVQVIIPHKTESYGSSNDPIEEGEIPYCTLKMFPEETFHCVEFARDKFGKLFTLRPKAVLKILEDPTYKPSSPEEIKALREAVKLLSSVPVDFSECIAWARRKFQKYFVNDIKQLLYTYPLEHKTKEGKNFWTMPKRPPQDISYDALNNLHGQFVSTFAYLRAHLFKIPHPTNWRSAESRNKVADQALSTMVKAWVPSEEKKKSIAQEVQKKEQPTDTEQDSVVSQLSLEEEQETLLEQLNKLRKLHATLSLNPEEFEKDEDQNGHIDFIHAFGNLRAANYKLEEMDWLTVKIKAGRIVPALATTTAVVAGLQTIELCKTIKGCKIDNMKNAFVNLATPYIQLTEPGSAAKIILNESITVNLWDRWDHKLPKATTTLKDLFSLLETTYQLIPKNVFLKSAPIYMSAVLDLSGKEKEKESILSSNLNKLLGLDKDETYIDLSINFTNKQTTDILQGVPIVRVIFE